MCPIRFKTGQYPHDRHHRQRLEFLRPPDGAVSDVLAKRRERGQHDGECQRGRQ